MHIKTKYLKAALLTVAGPKDTRDYLKGVLIEVYPNHVVIVSTDGTRLTLIRQEMDDGTSFRTGHYIIPASVIKSINNKIGEVEFHPSKDEGKIEMVDGPTATVFEPIDGKYPNFRNIIPRGRTSGIGANYKTSYVADAGKVSNLLGESRGDYVHICQNGNAAGVVRYKDENVIILIMPWITPITEDPTTEINAGIYAT